MSGAEEKGLAEEDSLIVPVCPVKQVVYQETKV